MHNAAVSFTLGSALKVIPRHSRALRSAVLRCGPAVMVGAAGVTELAAKTTEDKQRAKNSLAAFDPCKPELQMSVCRR